jgi:hypothetical protein
MLGTESGANVFDHDGSIRAAIEHALKENPELSYEEAHSRFVAEHEGKVLMNQISPKMFEAIAHRTALILFEGNYSGVVQPDRHFIPLKKDFSNVDDVLEKVQDDQYISAMTARAYEDVIASGKYSYARFISDFDRVVKECRIISAPQRFVSSVTATLDGDSIRVAQGIVSPRYLPSNHIFSAVAEREIVTSSPLVDGESRVTSPEFPAIVTDVRARPAVTAEDDTSTTNTQAPAAATAAIAGTEIREGVVGLVVKAADGGSTADRDVLDRLSTRVLVAQVARRVWVRLPTPLRSLLRPAATAARMLARRVRR